MGFRETLNQNPGITTGATAIIIVAALALIVWQLMSDNVPRGPIEPQPTTQSTPQK